MAAARVPCQGRCQVNEQRAHFAALVRGDDRRRCCADPELAHTISTVGIVTCRSGTRPASRARSTGSGCCTRARIPSAGPPDCALKLIFDPEFLFRIERDPPNVAAGNAYRLTDLELASRLSFFLWSSIPDDELLEQAAAGRLSESAVLEQQVRRMLADARAGANLALSWLYPSFPKGVKYLISLSFRGKASVRPAQVGGFDVNIVIHGSTAVRGRGDLVAYRWALWKLTAPWTHRTRPTAPWKTLRVFHELHRAFPIKSFTKNPERPQNSVGKPG